MNGLVLSRISHKFDSIAVVDDVSLEVGPGEILCLLGPSGCGKTTTLRIAAGLERVQRGEVHLAGRLAGSPSFHLPPEKRNIGMVFQDYALFPHLNVLENVTFGLVGENEANRRRTAMALLERLGMERYAAVYPHRLSGGEQQRVALARALAPRPAVMLMDEPFANLDVRLRDAIRDDTMALLHDEAAAAIMVTHDPYEAMRMADRIALMNNGRIVQIGEPADFHHHPASRFAATFFREMNVLQAEINSKGHVVTPLGACPAPAGRSHGEVEVVVPPEALQVRSDATNGGFRISDIRAVGPYDIVSLAGHENAALRAYSFDTRELSVGDPVAVTFDPERVFVFPAEKP